MTALGADHVRRHGDYITSTCPVHKGDNPTAFTFYINSGVWLCHTNLCHGERGGNVIELVQKTLDVDEPHAVQWLEELCGIHAYGLDVAAKAASLEFLKPVRRRTNRVFDEALLDKYFVRDADLNYDTYYRKRGYDPQTLDYFDVRYAFAGGRYHNRAIIPIHNEHGELVGVTGRWMGDYRADGKEKFLHTPGMNKSQILYNWHRARHYFNCGYVFLVESPGCVWGLHELGIYNAVAALGVDVSRDQAKLIAAEPNINTTILCFDIGGPGITGMERAAPKLYTTNVQLMYLPEGKDLDNISYIDFQRCYAARQSYQGESVKHEGRKV